MNLPQAAPVKLSMGREELFELQAMNIEIHQANQMECAPEDARQNAILTERRQLGIDWLSQRVEDSLRRSRRRRP